MQCKEPGCNGKVVDGLCRSCGVSVPEEQGEPLQKMIGAVFRNVTSARLKLLFVANCLIALVFCLVSVNIVNRHEYAVRTVGLDAAPSVMAAHQIKIGAEQMDANLTNELLVAPGEEKARRLIAAFEDRRRSVGQHIVAAAENITYGRAEQEPLEEIQAAAGKYEMQAQRARDMHEAGRSADAVKAYRAAMQTLLEKLLANADALNKANAGELERIYWRKESESALSSGLVLALGMLLLALLVITQIYLARRFHKRLNLPLLAATVCTIIVVEHVYSALLANARHLKVAKQDSYDSIVALLDARADAYSANAAQNRWILDREHAAEHETLFLNSVSSIAHFARDHDFSETIARAQKQLAGGQQIELPGFSGSLADELRNIRYDGEGRAALDALLALSDYRAADSKMRELARSGAYDEAIKVGLGYDPGSSKFPFTKFDDALGRALSINQDHFNTAVRAAFDDLRGLSFFVQATSLLIAICVYFGLRKHMAEYMD